MIVWNLFGLHEVPELYLLVSCVALALLSISTAAFEYRAYRRKLRFHA